METGTIRSPRLSVGISTENVALKGQKTGLIYNKPDPVCDSEKYKLLLDYDFKIQTDHHIEHKQARY